MQSVFTLLRSAARGLLSHRRPLLALLVTAVLVVVPHRAAAQTTAGVDQVLGALAEVLQDRAKRVAAHTLKRKLLDGLCSKHEVKVGGTTLYFGDKEPASQCGQDNVLVRSCQLAADDALDASDVAFLKALGKDTVSLSMRLAAIQIPDCEYQKKAHLADVADYLFNVMEKASSKQLDLLVLARQTEALSDELEAPPESNQSIDRIASISALGTLRAAVTKGLQDQCWPATCTTVACRAACTAIPNTVLLDDTTKCAAYNEPSARDDRAAKYDAAALSSKECGGDELTCVRGHLALDLSFYLDDLACNSQTGDNGARRKTFRQLTYLIWDSKTLGNYLSGVSTIPGSARTDLSTFVTEATKISVSELGEYPRLEIASAVRAIGAALEAEATDHQGLVEWTQDLTGGSVSELLNSPALNWRNRRKLSVSVKALRDAVKDLLTRPRFALAISLTEAAAARDLERAVVSGVRSIVSLAAASKGSIESTLGLLSTAFAQNAEVVHQLTNIKGVNVTLLDKTSESLKSAADLVAKAQQHDWIGLSIDAIDQIPESDRTGAFGRSLTFTRTLMAMYQADNKEDAKAIFAAKLEDEDSREKRFDVFAIDIAGHLALRAGGQWNRFQGPRPEGAESNVALYGLYAPIGVQFAYKGIGALIYPVDLGSYLVFKQQQKNEDGPKAWDAFRGGAFLYLRPSAAIPLDFGVAADYRPYVDNKAEGRVFGSVSMELPLFSIY